MKFNFFFFLATTLYTSNNGLGVGCSWNNNKKWPLRPLQGHYLPDTKWQGEIIPIGFNQSISNLTKHSFTKKEKNKGVCHNVALPFTLKKYLKKRQKNYGTSNISPCKNIIFKKKKSSKKETKILQDIIITL